MQVQTDKVKQEAAERLCRIAEQMETCEDPRERKELSRQYKAASIDAGIIDENGDLTNGKEFMYKPEQIAASEQQAMLKVVEYLDKIEHWSQELVRLQGGSSTEYIAISYIANWKGMPCEINLEIPDSFYRSFNGVACYKARKTLFSATQLQAYRTIEYGLIAYGLDLLKGEPRKAFFEKYAVPINKKIAANAEASSKPASKSKKKK